MKEGPGIHPPAAGAGAEQEQGEAPPRGKNSPLCSQLPAYEESLGP